MRKLIRYFFAPSIWLSGRLSFSKKYALIGFLALIAMTILSLPLIKQAHENSQLANLESLGLAVFTEQSNTLAELINLRSMSIRGEPSEPSAELNTHIEKFANAARHNQLVDLAEKLSSNWLQIKNLSAEGDAQRRFAIHTAVINTMLRLIRETARIHRLNVDKNLDTTFDMLTNRIPLVMDTLGKQMDAFTLNTEAIRPYALGAQITLTEAIPSLWSGINQLEKINANSSLLQNYLRNFLAVMAQQQDLADKIVSEPETLADLHIQADANIQLLRQLLNESANLADNYLVGKINQFRKEQLLIATVMLTAIMGISYLFAGIYFSTLRSLRSLSDGTNAFCEGQLDTRITIETRDELVLVSRNFNTLASEFQRLLNLIHYQNETRQQELETQVQLRTAELAEKNQQLRAAGERVQKELQLARSMQSAILPQHFPNETSWSVYASMHPALELGGDFYDCFALPDGRFGVVIADVSGKGVAAAFFMAVSRTVLLHQAETGNLPSVVLAQANDLLCDHNPMDLFVTACYGIYNPNTGEFVYAIAGHPACLHRSVTGEVSELVYSRNMALGIVRKQKYNLHTAVLAAGDTLLLYTDGVTEAFSSSGETFGETRLIQWLAQTAPDDNASSIINGLLANIATHVLNAEASDDLTCLALCRKRI